MRKILQYAYLAFIYLFSTCPSWSWWCSSTTRSSPPPTGRGSRGRGTPSSSRTARSWEAFANSLIIAGNPQHHRHHLRTLGARHLPPRFGRKVTFSFIYVHDEPPTRHGDLAVGVLHPVGLSIGATTLLLAHTTSSSPFVVVTVFARISGFDRHIIDVAKDLAGELKMFRHVIMPMLMPAIIAGWLLSFTLSMDDVVVSSSPRVLLRGSAAQDLPMVRIGIKPEINALSAVMFPGRCRRNHYPHLNCKGEPVGGKGLLSRLSSCSSLAVRSEERGVRLQLVGVHRPRRAYVLREGDRDQGEVLHP